jgi:hypothetical protein
MTIYYLIPYAPSFPNCDLSSFNPDEVQICCTSNRVNADLAGGRYEYELSKGEMWSLTSDGTREHNPSTRHVEVLPWWDAKLRFGESMDSWKCNRKARER